MMADAPPASSSCWTRGRRSSPSPITAAASGWSARPIGSRSSRAVSPRPPRPRSPASRRPGDLRLRRTGRPCRRRTDAPARRALRSAHYLAGSIQFWQYRKAGGEPVGRGRRPPGQARPADPQPRTAAAPEVTLRGRHRADHPPGRHRFWLSPGYDPETALLLVLGETDADDRFHCLIGTTSRRRSSQLMHPFAASRWWTSLRAADCWRPC